MTNPILTMRERVARAICTEAHARARSIPRADAWTSFETEADAAIAAMWEVEVRPGSLMEQLESAIIDLTANARLDGGGDEDENSDKTDAAIEQIYALFRAALSEQFNG